MSEKPKASSQEIEETAFAEGMARLFKGESGGPKPSGVVDPRSDAWKQSPDNPANQGPREGDQIEQRRIAEENAAYARGGPVAGHDFEEEQER